LFTIHPIAKACGLSDKIFGKKW